MSLLDVPVLTKCEVCGDVIASTEPCKACAQFEAFCETRRVRRAVMLDEEERGRIRAAIPRTDVGVVKYVEPPHIPAVMVIGGLLGLIVIPPMAWHFGKMLIAFLCGVS